MFVLDTNVISELMRPAPHQAVFAWVAAQPGASLYTTSVSRAEILSGIGIMPEGRRRAALRDAAAAMFDEDPRGRVFECWRQSVGWSCALNGGPRNSTLHFVPNALSAV